MWYLLIELSFDELKLLRTKVTENKIQSCGSMMIYLICEQPSSQLASQIAPNTTESTVLISYPEIPPIHFSEGENWYLH